MAQGLSTAGEGPGFNHDGENGAFQVSQGVRLFDPKLRICLATDYSGEGVGFMLLQKTCTCDSKIPNYCSSGWKIVLIGSRFLHDAEQCYAPIEGECLAFYSIELIFVNISSMDKRNLRSTELYEGFLS